jgi:hypothetical protein
MRELASAEKVTLSDLNERSVAYLSAWENACNVVASLSGIYSRASRSGAATHSMRSMHKPPRERAAARG